MERVLSKERKINTKFLKDNKKKRGKFVQRQINGLENERLDSLVVERVESLSRNSQELERLSLSITQRIEYEEKIQNLTKNINLCNAKMEHYAFIASHKLRGPVASLKGLLSLYEKGADYQKNEEVIAMMEQMVNILMESLQNVMQKITDSEEKNGDSSQWLYTRYDDK